MYVRGVEGKEQGGRGEAEWVFVGCSVERSVTRRGSAAESSNRSSEQRERAEFEHGRPARVSDAESIVQSATVAASATSVEQCGGFGGAAAAGSAAADAFGLLAARGIQCVERFHEKRRSEHGSESCEQCVVWVMGAVERHRRFGEEKAPEEGSRRLRFLVVAGRSVRDKPERVGRGSPRPSDSHRSSLMLR